MHEVGIMESALVAVLLLLGMTWVMVMADGRERGKGKRKLPPTPITWLLRAMN
jgi:hypothetical protein